MDGSGNSIVTGSFDYYPIVFGAITLNNNGQADMFIVKYDNNGNVLWAKSAGGSSSEQSSSVAVDGFGNMFVTGWFNSSAITLGTTTLNNNSISRSDIFIAKYDNNGNVLWAKSAGGGEDDRETSVAVDVSGNAVVTGSFESSSITFGTTILNNNYAYDIFIVKYDNNGNVLWAKSAGGNAHDIVTSIITDSSGSSIITGYFSSQFIIFGADTLNNSNSNGTSDIFIVKVDINGSFLWAKVTENSTNEYASDYASSITLDGSENVFITGNFQASSISFGSTTLNNNGGTDLFLAKLAKLWITISTVNVNCEGGSDGSATASAFGGSSPYTYNWNTTPAQITTTATGLLAGNYTVTVTDANSLTATTVVKITEPTVLIAIVADSTISNVSCSGGSNGAINIFVSGGIQPYFYNWNNGENTKDISELSAGAYTVTIADANGCTTNASFTLTNPPALTSILTKVDATPPCDNGHATVIASGGTSPYTYTWNSNPVQNSATTSNLSAPKMYIVTVTDSKNCLKQDSIMVDCPMGIFETVSGNAINLYPNPTSTHLIIDNGNFNSMPGYKIKIENTLGQKVFESLITQSQFTLDLSSWSGKGIYFLYIYDGTESLIAVRKIVLQ